MERDNAWLAEKLNQIWKNHFPDITHGNEIEVRFGRNSKTRLGSITLRKIENKKRRLLSYEVRELSPNQAVSIITINGYFKNESAPEKIIDGILAHEFCHYVHGFNSTIEKRYRTPHAGGIIDKELKERGMEDLLIFQKKWLKENWKNIIENKF